MAIQHIGIVGIHTRALDASIDFYTQKLGFEKRHDEPMGPGARWVEVAPAGAQTRLSLLAPGNPGFVEARIADGVATSFEVTDFEATCEEFKRRGVRFHKEPKKEFWGYWAEIVDPDGNVLGLHAELERAAGRS